MNKISSFFAIAFFISAGVNAADTPKMHQQAAAAHEMMNNCMAQSETIFETCNENTLCFHFVYLKRDEMYYCLRCLFAIRFRVWSIVW